MKPILQLRSVDLVFGSRPRSAFSLLDQGQSRSEIQKACNQVVGVHSVSLDIFPGEIFTLMGLSGSGKSSLLRCMNGLNGRSAGMLRGQVHFHSHTGQTTDLQKCSDSELRDLRRHQISMVFQQFGLMPWETVLENVAFPLKIQGVAKKERLARAEEKLTLVGLKDWIRHYPSQLSGGMQQRVGLARAFVTDAQVLLMDEPFSALDPIYRRMLQEELLSFQEKLQKTIVFVTHDMNEASFIADRVAILEDGQILQVGAPHDVIANPNCDRVRKFTLRERSISRAEN